MLFYVMLLIGIHYVLVLILIHHVLLLTWIQHLNDLLIPCVMSGLSNNTARHWKHAVAYRTPDFEDNGAGLAS